MICPYCKKELIPFRIKIEGRESNLIGWLCQCTDEIRDNIVYNNNITNDLLLKPITKMKKEMELQSQGNVLNKAFYKDHPEEDVSNNKS